MPYSWLCFSRLCSQQQYVGSGYFYEWTNSKISFSFLLLTIFLFRKFWLLDDILNLHILATNKMHFCINRKIKTSIYQSARIRDTDGKNKRKTSADKKKNDKLCFFFFISKMACDSQVVVFFKKFSKKQKNILCAFYFIRFYLLLSASFSHSHTNKKKKRKAIAKNRHKMKREKRTQRSKKQLDIGHNCYIYLHNNNI